MVYFWNIIINIAIIHVLKIALVHILIYYTHEYFSFTTFTYKCHVQNNFKLRKSFHQHRHRCYIGPGYI